MPEFVSVAHGFPSAKEGAIFRCDRGRPVILFKFFQQNVLPMYHAEITKIRNFNYS